MSSGQTGAPKSPLLAAVGISLVIAIGSMIGTLDMAQVEDVTSGKFLTRPLVEAQQRNTLAIVTIENTLGAISKDIDFVSKRVSAAMNRSEEQVSDRFAHLDAEIAALKDKIAGIQHARIETRTAEPQRDQSADIVGLRSSMNEIASQHGGAIAAITKRLERIEIGVGLSTDMTSSVSTSTQKTGRRPLTLVKPAKKQNTAPPAEAAPMLFPTPAASAARPDRNNMFNMKPISQQGAPLRISRLPG